ncbi:MAG TPA: biotin--[acetyl-CoA-carboxylase] ligase [Steroidobacteraceae bacterium]|nr:biotin--[acetyl-CoA-carboxylase] ligase [Steroidobacteraceae bacterium]
MTRRTALLRLMADGTLHSGEALARELGVTRAAVAKQVRRLAEWGLAVESVPRRGHRLLAPLDLLDAERLQASLTPLARARLERLELVDEIASTNSHLLAANGLPAGRWRACLAEYQSAGRGRRGRGWIAPYASGLCLSFGWLLADPPAGLATLSLAAGVAVLRALTAQGVTDLTLKWPNDVLKDGRKLGGILCELKAEAAGPAYVVVGIGLNVHLPAAARAGITAGGGLEPADLATDERGSPPSRTALAAALLDALVAMALEFEAHGFAPFWREWSRADALRDRPVRVLAHASERDGVARGIDADGALCVEVGGQLERLASGEVTLRAVA